MQIDLYLKLKLTERHKRDVKLYGPASLAQALAKTLLGHNRSVEEVEFEFG